jgi:hypothetical protein
MKPIPDWLTAHPIAFALGLFALSAVISIYSKEIKTFLHTWPRNKVRAGFLSLNRNRLSTLQHLHNNPYGLVLYLAREVFGLIYIFPLFLIAYTALMYLLAAHFTPTGMAYIAWGLVYGRTVHI